MLQKRLQAIHQMLEIQVILVNSIHPKSKNLEFPSSNEALTVTSGTRSRAAPGTPRSTSQKSLTTETTRTCDLSSTEDQARLPKTSNAPLRPESSR